MTYFPPLRDWDWTPQIPPFLDRPVPERTPQAHPYICGYSSHKCGPHVYPPPSFVPSHRCTPLETTGSSVSTETTFFWNPSRSSSALRVDLGEGRVRGMSPLTTETRRDPVCFFQMETGSTNRSGSRVGQGHFPLLRPEETETHEGDQGCVAS